MRVVGCRKTRLGLGVPKCDCGKVASQPWVRGIFEGSSYERMKQNFSSLRKHRQGLLAQGQSHRLATVYVLTSPEHTLPFGLVWLGMVLGMVEDILVSCLHLSLPFPFSSSRSFHLPYTANIDMATNISEYERDAVYSTVQPSTTNMET